ncbi:alpha/beta fold hydrolase [Sphingobium boeckii]|uniref:Pimeloyl-ACP methyl ester carboxylesterase n=1 Tax=Sphingobium boeckii TaxID=1082345 RepID=A0A7W9AG85_9SPHN|nr:alpha/beta hydrolase [Sphingobium boeckii]MBB5685064.1 pimeloyl-ACP methyl ester carboxylesterase [Sphingobium boeckii]
MAAYDDGYWWSGDNLRLHYRDYPGSDAQPPVICIPGLTRNARDFEGVAARLAGERRVICVDLRGRGESAYAKDPMTYVPLTYAQDLERLIAELALNRFVMIGTSLGGIVSMLLAATGPARVAGVILNDVGPVIEQKGLDRIRGYVGRGSAWPTWVHAARTLGEVNAAVYPDYDLEDWLRMAKQLYKLNAKGRIVPDYDSKIAEPFRLPGGEAGVDLWPAIEAMKTVPLLMIRGALSDILSETTAAEVKKRVKGSKLVTVPETGHTPTLDEPAAARAIDRFLGSLQP